MQPGGELNRYRPVVDGRGYAFCIGLFGVGRGLSVNFEERSRSMKPGIGLGMWNWGVDREVRKAFKCGKANVSDGCVKRIALSPDWRSQIHELLSRSRKGGFTRTQLIEAAPQAGQSLRERPVTTS